MKGPAGEHDGAGSIYRHRQIGTSILWPIGAATVATGVILVLTIPISPRFAVIGAVVLLVLLTAMVLFGTLTTEVSRYRVVLWFGPGWIRKEFPVREIRRVEAVRNRWYYGWGIRLTPYGWLFNVSGLDAVEIELVSGRRYRIGTDEPQRLLSAIRSVLD